MKGIKYKSGQVFSEKIILMLNDTMNYYEQGCEVELSDRLDFQNVTNIASL
jgi:hypothetical protein